MSATAAAADDDDSAGKILPLSAAKSGPLQFLEARFYSNPSEPPAATGSSPLAPTWVEIRLPVARACTRSLCADCCLRREA